MQFMTSAMGRTLGVLVALASASGSAGAAEPDGASLAALVDELSRSLMTEHEVPGMAVGIVANGQRQVFTYGVTAPGGDRKVSEKTIFEVGSLSKPFTATLAAHAVATGRMDLSDPASRIVNELEGTPAGGASVLDLGTYAAGGLPLQFPDEVRDQDGMVAYYRGWRPDFEPSTTRLYSNPSIGLFGYLAARSTGRDFADLMKNELLPAFGLADTFVSVPDDRMDDYAFGRSRDGRAVRVNPGMFDAEAYGIKTTASDLLRFVELNIDPSGLPGEWRRAVEMTQVGRYRAGPVVQALGWELYAEPVSLQDLVEGNSTAMALEPQKIEPVSPTLGPVLVNKTGSTGGFGAYAAFVPSRGIGVVMLANRNVPNAARVAFAHAVLERLR